MKQLYINKLTKRSASTVKTSMFSFLLILLLSAGAHLKVVAFTYKEPLSNIQKSNYPEDLTSNTTDFVAGTQRIEAAVPDVNAGADKMLTCAVTEVTLEGSSTTEGVTYSWSGPESFTSSTATPIVSIPGTYTLTVTDPQTGSSASDVVEVTQQTKMPNIHFIRDPGTDYFTCNQKEVRIRASIGPSDRYLFEWEGPDGFTSNSSSITVYVVGTYTLTVTDLATGCKSTTSTKAWEFYPDMSADGGPDQVLTCSNKTVTLKGSVTGTPFHHWYTGDGEHIVFNRLNLEVDKPGKYVLWAIETNSGCIVTDTVEVKLATETPTISAEGGKLNSGNGTVQLIGSSTTNNVAYSWSGPFGYTSTEQNPVVDVAGNYTLTVTSELGCTATMTVTVDPPQSFANTQHSSQVKVYPNPVKDKAKIEFKLRAKESYVVNLHDMNGNLVRELKAGSTKTAETISVEFDGSDLPDGLYLARIVSTSDTKTVQVILKK